MKQQADDEIHSDIAAAMVVIDKEIEGLKALTNVLNDQFVSVVDMVSSLKGRLIISGMGKSGHIARKIAATMASTGTPSYFVHPSEASHGDLGMITKDDAVMLLSNSGETSELRDVIAYCSRFAIPLIGLVRRSTSALVEAADFAVVMPEVAEASPVGAPTTSTTMMLAYGDALAVALLERKGFTPEDFNVFHPGGKLGQAFIKVSGLMHGADELPLIDKSSNMQEALLEMTAKHFGCVGVLGDSGALIGVVTDGDLRRHMSDDLVTKQVADVMSSNPATISPNSLAAEALGVMNQKSITCLFAVDDKGKPVGIIHIHDCLRAGIL